MWKKILHKSAVRYTYDDVASTDVAPLLHLLIDDSTHLITLLKRDGTISKINKAACDSLQVDEADVLGTYFWDAPWWGDAGDRQEQLRGGITSASHGEFVNFEITAANVDKQLIDLAMSLKPVKDMTGRVVLIIAEGRNVTERKKAEKALRESEWKFRAIFNQNFQLMGILSLDGIVIEVNATSLKLGGVDESEVKGKPFWDTPWWEHSKDLQNKLREAIKACASGECIAFEVTHPAADGTLHYLDFFIRPLRDDAGNIVFLIPEARDITGQKNAEKALREAAAKFRIVADNTYNWEFWVSPEGNYIYSSPSCWRVTGHTAEELVANPGMLESLIHPDDMPAWKNHRQHAVRSKTLNDIEFRLLRDGDLAWIHHVCTPIWGDDGVFLGTRGSFEDVTQRKQAEEKNLQLASVVESSDDAIFGKTVDGIISSWNRGAENIFGYQEEEVVGRPVTMLFPPERKEEVLGLHERIRGGEHIEHYEIPSRKKDGDLIDMSFTYSPIKDELGRVVAISVTGRDITARNQAVAAMLERDRIKKELELHEKELLLLRQNRLAAMGEMIGNIAHQWRQPLNLLALRAQELNLVHGTAEFTAEYLKEHVAKMMETIRHMSSTIDEFRDFTGHDEEKKDFSVLAVVNKTISLLQRTWNAEQVEITVVAKCDPVVTGYPKGFSQVLHNILMNARDAFVRRNVKTPTIKIEISTISGRSVVAITDNAGGVPEDIIDKIFDPYFTTKGPEQGNGIGLYVSKTIIEKDMGGSLTVRNVDGGAQFHIVI